MFYCQKFRMTLHGFPTATQFSGMERVTTLPAPMTLFLPIVTPERRIAPPPIQAPPGSTRLPRLCLFMENPDTVLSPEQILGRLWDCEGKYIDNNTLTVYIRRLRTKIEDDPADPQRIVTVRRMGYKWNTAKRGETACRSCGMRSGTKCTAESETWNCLE